MNSRPKTRIEARNKLGWRPVSRCRFNSISQAAHNLSPIFCDSWSWSGLYKSLASYSFFRPWVKTGKIQLKTWSRLWSMGRRFNSMWFVVNEVVTYAYQKHRYEQQWAPSRGFNGRSLCLRYSMIYLMIKWKSWLIKLVWLFYLHWWIKIVF